jgi:hypothetical protein
MNNKTAISTTILSNPVMQYFFEEEVPSEQRHFEDPFSLSQKVLNCGHAQSEVLMFEKRSETRRGKEQVTDLHVSGIFRRIVTAPLNGLLKPKPEKTSHMGTRHTVLHFPAFKRLFPERGLPVGKGCGLYWISPLKVEYTAHRTRGPSEGDRIISTFWIEFKNGTKGATGFMDLIKANGGFSRWHVYPSGDVTSADLYSDHRNNHDAFRTLMVNILQFEIKSDVANAPSGDIGIIKTQWGKGAQTARQSGASLTPVVPPHAPTQQ